MIMITEFRSWNPVTEKMYHDFDQSISEVKLGKSIHQFVYDNALVFDTLMQYTGLKDKNRKKYCQDDIVKYKNKFYRLIKGTYMFELAGFNDSSQCTPSDFFSENAYKEGEIVGNIYQNPNYLL